MTWLSLPAITWEWIFIAILSGIAIAARALPRMPWLSNEYCYDSWSSRRYYVAAAILAGMALHIAGFLGTFDINDDQHLIADDLLVIHLSFANLRALAATDFHGTFQHLTYVTAALNWALAGERYWLWYLCNWLLLIPILYCVARLSWRLTGSTTRAALAAVFFAATPVVAESLCWMNARGQWLGLCFALASCVIYLEYRWCAARHKPAWLALSVGLFALALLAPPTFIYLPLWLVVFDVWDRRRDWRVLLAEKAPYFALATWTAYRLLSSPGTRFAAPPGDSYFHTLLMDANLLVEYTRTLLMPVATGLEPPLNVPDGWLSAPGSASILTINFAPLASVIMIAAGGFIVFVLKRRHGWSLPLLWAAAVFVSLLPAMNIPGHGLAGAFEYRYTLSAHVVSAILLADFALRLTRGKQRWGKAARAVSLGLVLAYLGWAVSVTLSTSVAWRSPAAYWHRMTELYPTSYAALYRAGKIAQRASRHAQAVDYLQRALVVNTGHDFQVYRRLGESLYFMHDYAGARKYWRIYYTENPYEITDKMRRRFRRINLQLPEE